MTIGQSTPDEAALPRWDELDLVVFDLDGTLYPTCPVLDEAYPAAVAGILVRRLGLPPDEARRLLAEKKLALERALGGHITNVRTLLWHWPEATFEELEEAVDAATRVEELIGPDERTIETLGRLAASLPIALFTTNLGRTAERILTRLGLARFFPPERRFTLSDAGRLDLPREEQMRHVKPDVEGYRWVLRKFGVAGDRTLMVGDSEFSDLRPASEAGMRTYHVRTPADLHVLPERLGLP